MVIYNMFRIQTSHFVKYIIFLEEFETKIEDIPIYFVFPDESLNYYEFKIKIIV